MTFAVFRRSASLRNTEKLLLGLVLELDNPSPAGPGGCFKQQTKLAGDLGASERQLRDSVLSLEFLGLIRRVHVGRRDRLFVAWPEFLEEPPSAGGTSAALGRWIARQAQALDEHIGRLDPQHRRPHIEARADCGENRRRHDAQPTGDFRPAEQRSSPSAPVSIGEFPQRQRQILPESQPVSASADTISKLGYRSSPAPSDSLNRVDATECLTQDNGSTAAREPIVCDWRAVMLEEAARQAARQKAIEVGITP